MKAHFPPWLLVVAMLLAGAFSTTFAQLETHGPFSFEGVPDQEIVVEPHQGARAAGHIEVRFTVDEIPVSSMLVTRGLYPALDGERVRDAPGTFGLWIWQDAIHATLVHPDTQTEGVGESVMRSRYGVLEAGTEHVAVLSWGPSGVALLLDGELMVHDVRRTHGTQESDAPLIVGGSGGGQRLAAGTIEIALHDGEAAFVPCQVDPIGSVNNSQSVSDGVPDGREIPECNVCETQYCAPVSFSWINPTEYVDDSPLAADEIINTALLCSEAGDPEAVLAGDMTLAEGNVTEWDVLLPAGEHYCGARTLAANGLFSDLSNVVEASVEPPPGTPLDLDAWVPAGEEGPLVTVDTLAYTRQPLTGLDAQEVIPVAEIALGVPCIETEGVMRRGEVFHGVPRAEVAWLSDSTRPQALYARCARATD